MQSAQPTITRTNAYPTPSAHVQREVARRLKRGDGKRVSDSKRTAMVGGHVVARYDVPSEDASHTNPVTLWPGTNRSTCNCRSCRYSRKDRPHWCAAQELAVMAGQFEGRA